MSQNPLPCSQAILESLHEGVHEVIGPLGAAELFPTSDSRPEPSGWAAWVWLSEQLELAYGSRGSQGVARRVGRASFHWWLKQFGAQQQLIDLEFRLLPLQSRLRSGLERIAEVFRAETGLSVEVREEGNRWGWWVSAAEDPKCQTCLYQMMAGFLQEFFAWASGGRFFPLAEQPGSAWSANGLAVMVQKQPID